MVIKIIIHNKFNCKIYNIKNLIKNNNIKIRKINISIYHV